MVVQRGVNDDAIAADGRAVPRHRPILRFIEYMDVGTSNGWQLDDVVPAAEIVAASSPSWPLEPADPNYPGEVASRYRYADGQRRDRRDRVGHASPSAAAARGPACRPRASSSPACSRRAAPTCERRCARAPTTRPLRALIGGVWGRRADRYSELRTAETARRPKVEMSHIGG